MPGTPPTTPRLGIARFATTDPDQVPIDLNTVVDRVDVVAGRFESGLLASRPSTGAGIADRYYYATDEGVLYRDAGGASPTWTAVNPRTRALVTALPGSPFTGQEILFQDATVLGPANIVWPLRYDGTKWVPIGCTPLFASVDTSESTTTTNAYQDLATNGPQITVPVAGDYLFDMRAHAQPSAAAAPLIGLSIGGAAPVSFVDDAAASVTAAGLIVSISREIKKTGVAAAAAAKIRYAPGAAATTTFARRSLKVTPLRLG